MQFILMSIAHNLYLSLKARHKEQNHSFNNYSYIFKNKCSKNKFCMV